MLVGYGNMSLNTFIAALNRNRQQLKAHISAGGPFRSSNMASGARNPAGMPETRRGGSCARYAWSKSAIEIDLDRYLAGRRVKSMDWTTSIGPVFFFSVILRRFDRGLGNFGRV